MSEPKFILSKSKLLDQVKRLKDLGFKISYSYKTNNVVGDILQDLDKEIYFSIHSKNESDKINNKSKIWFFCQAESIEEFEKILEKGIKNFVIDNEVDLERLLNIVAKENVKINLSLRMKFREHRIGSGKYFVYGMPVKKVSELILRKLKNNKFIDNLGVHLHRKTQNTSEWNILEELKDSFSDDVLDKINFVNIGGGLPSIYRSSNEKVYSYIFSKLKEVREWLDEKNVEAFIEPGRFLAAPCVRLVTEIIQKYGGNLIVNTTIYNCALDTLLTGTRMLVEGELDQEEGKFYLIKGNSPTRDDIFRYKVKLKESVGVGDEIVFLNAGAYNYSTDFFGYKKLRTEIVEDF